MTQNLLKLTLKSPPFSINQAYYKKSFTRTKECREWGESIQRQICTPDARQKIADFLSALPPKFALHVNLRFHYPEEKLYTKKGDISRRSMDLSNIEKMLIDLLFDKRHAGRALDCGTIATSLALDDKLITKLVSEKVLQPAPEHRIDIEVESIPL